MAKDPAFEATFGRPPETAFFSPGRVNLLGEHTDYNEGLVLPMAIAQGTRFLVAARTDARFRVHSEAFDETVELAPADAAGGSRGHWSDYLLGVLEAFPGGGFETPGVGADILLRSDLPAGRGLSSSASLTLGFAGVLDALTNSGLDRFELARIARAAENDFVGLACGILDPFAVAVGRPGHVLALDCGTLDWKAVPFPSDAWRILLADTGVARSLAGSRYNERRAECERARALAGGDRLLGNLEPADFAPEAPLAKDPVARRRARHVWSENRRVAEAVTALEAGDLARFGALMSASHRSLRDDYAVSCPELDAMAELLWAMDGVAGAKMTGAGFGGAVVAVVSADRLPAVLAALPGAYEQRTGKVAALLECAPAAGFSRVA